MRKKPFFMLWVLWGSLLFSQDVIQNPAFKGKARVLDLEEALRITDKSGEFFFSGPRDVQIDPEGYLYLSDKAQLLKFTPEGEFVKNLVKTGQGPGEISGRIRFHVHGDRIYIYGSQAGKMVCLGKEGRYADEFRLEGYADFLGLFEERFLMLKNTWPPLRETTGDAHIGHRIFQVGREGGVIKKSPDFPTPVFVGPDYTSRWLDFQCSLDKENHILYISHTGEYRIKALDLRENKVIREFSREYPRVKRKKSGRFPRKGKFLPEYENDISGLFYDRGRLWVKTSAPPSEKGRLFDVFDDRGRYADWFCLELFAKLMAVDEDSIIVSETDYEKTGLISIVKYRILN